jgi:hypothetical protein
MESSVVECCAFESIHEGEAGAKRGKQSRAMRDKSPHGLVMDDAAEKAAGSVLNDMRHDGGDGRDGTELN